MDTINLEPSDEGYANIARMFAGNILGDVIVRRRKPAKQILGSLVEIAGYLAVKDPAAFKALLADIKGE